MSFSDTQCLFLDVALLMEILKGSLFLDLVILGQTPCTNNKRGHTILSPSGTVQTLPFIPYPSPTLPYPYPYPTGHPYPTQPHPAPLYPTPPHPYPTLSYPYLPLPYHTPTLPYHTLPYSTPTIPTIPNPTLPQPF